MKSTTKVISAISLMFSLIGVSCSHIKTAREDQISKEVDQELASPYQADTKVDSKHVSSQDVQTLEKMNKAIEDYVHRKNSKEVTKLCKDLRFDCYLDNKIFPKGRKTVKRSLPPYATGSKMGTHGEDRVQMRYEFFPQ